MKIPVFTMMLFIHAAVEAQNLQLHYDMRHSLDPENNPRNFASLTFEYFKQIDTVGTGSFLLKMQADFKGAQGNVGQVFTQVSQSLKFWKPKVYLSLNYSGGLGIANDVYGYYLSNSFAAGISYPFQWKGAWLATVIVYRYNAFRKPSYDPQFTFYFGKGFFDYKIFVSGSFVSWTENRDRGEDYTRGMTGKKFAFFGDPQIWFSLVKGMSVGTRINVYYHLITNDDRIQLYPTIGVKYQF
ncbi:MAG: DUF5020 family protein [Chryseolinea sp.]